MMKRLVNLNADLGESFGAWSMGDDAALLGIVTSANVACGFHAGDPAVMRRTVRMAREQGVSIGAHPSYPDLQGFGRRRMDIAPEELEAMIAYQVGALTGIAQCEGARVTHVKPHGALNNMACADPALARAVARAVADIDRSLILLAPALSHLAEAGRESGLAVVEELYADRNYMDDGQLVPRARPDAMIHGAEAALSHVLRMLDESAVVSVDGKRHPVAAGSVCVHGDGKQALAVARSLKDGLQAHGYTLATLPAVAAARL